MNINRNGNRVEFSLSDKERQRTQKNAWKSLQARTLETRTEDSLMRLTAVEQRLEAVEKRLQVLEELEAMLKEKVVI